MLMLADKQEDRSRCITVGADKAYNAEGFVVAPGYGISLTCGWLVERASNPENRRLYFNRWL